MKINKNVLIIGGLGHWSQKTYIKALNKKYFAGNLYICDIKECKNKPNYYQLQNIEEKDVVTVRDIVIKNKIDVVIISTPPEKHFMYLNAFVDMGINIICDKPLISDINYKNILTKYNKILAIKKANIYTPLRRQIQSFYTTIYKNIKQVREHFDQNVKLVCYYENDGSHRWDDEMEIDFAHGYKSGLGKLSHTGYHIIDIMSRIIVDGCKNIKSVACEIVDENDVKDNRNSKTNKILQKVIGVTPDRVNLQDITCKAELDITVKYTLRFLDDNPSYFYLFLRHSGVSNRTTFHYDSINTGDDGRTDDSIITIEQGALQNIYGAVFADSSPNGSLGESYINLKKHVLVANELNCPRNEMIKIKNTKELSTKQIVRDLICAFYDEELKETYINLEFGSQKLTMELYVAALLAKQKKQKIEWVIGKLNDSLC